MIRYVYSKRLNNAYMNLRVTFESSRSNIHTSIPQKKDHYETLNVDRKSTRQEIKLAYYKLSKQYHPDVNKAESAENYFKEIQQAYGVLGDEASKREYDESLRGGNRDVNETRRSSPSYQAWSKRNGPIYTGRTSAYDYDEHYRSHYPKNERRTYGGGGGGGGPHMDANPFRSPNQEDLNKYWDSKEFEQFDETKIRNKIMLRSIYILLVFVIFNLVLSIASKNERDHGLNALKKQNESKNQR
jgi:curved DNA-binding protein CbpA